MSRQRGVFSSFLEAEWPEIRKRCRSRFVWRNRVLPLGLPLGLWGVLWLAEMDGLSVGDLLTVRGAALAYSAMAVMIASTYYLARVEWAEREEKYLKRNNQDEDK